MQLEAELLCNISNVNVKHTLIYVAIEVNHGDFKTIHSFNLL